MDEGNNQQVSYDNATDVPSNETPISHCNFLQTTCWPFSGLSYRSGRSAQFRNAIAIGDSQEFAAMFRSCHIKLTPSGLTPRVGTARSRALSSRTLDFEESIFRVLKRHNFLSEYRYMKERVPELRYSFLCNSCWGHAVAWLVKALCYKPEGNGFGSRCGH
jgi:hypothetical protein